MGIIGSNILNMALNIVGRQRVKWFKANGRVTNSVGLDVAAFDDAIPIYGSFQPVPRTMFVVLGLDFEKEYVNYYTSNRLTDIVRDKSPDEFEFEGSRYQVMSNTDWTKIDGWLGSMAVKIA